MAWAAMSVSISAGRRRCSPCGTGATTAAAQPRCHGSQLPLAPALAPCLAGSTEDQRRIERQLKEREEQHRQYEEAKAAAAKGAGLRQFGAASSEVRLCRVKHRNSKNCQSGV